MQGRGHEDVPDTMAQKILEGEHRVTQNVPDANETRRVVQGIADGPDANHSDIDGRMQLAEHLVSKRACRGGGRMTGLTDNDQRAQTREPPFHAHL